MVSDRYRYFGSSTLKIGKPFLYLNCYQWLHKTYLWKMIIAAGDANKNDKKTAEEKSLIDASSSSGEQKQIAPTDSTASERRPVGTKRAASQVKQLAVLERGPMGLKRWLTRARSATKSPHNCLNWKRRTHACVYFILRERLLKFAVGFLKLSRTGFPSKWKPSKRLLKQPERRNDQRSRQIVFLHMTKRPRRRHWFLCLMGDLCRTKWALMIVQHKWPRVPYTFSNNYLNNFSICALFLPSLSCLGGNL